MIRAARKAPEDKTPVLGGNSAAAHALRQIVALAGRSFEAIQLSGEDDAGHRDLAKAIHELSVCPDLPFIDATTKHFTEDHFAFRWEGTLYLGEVGRLSLSLQRALLSWIESDDSAMVRIISIRPDRTVSRLEVIPELCGPLTTFHIPYPALSQRKEDIPIMMQRIWANDPYPLPPIFDRSGWTRLLSHQWPGNFGELRNFAERTSRSYGGRTVSAEHVGRMMGHADHQAIYEKPLIDLKQHLAQEEKLFMIEALLRSGGIVQQAADISGLKRTTFLAKMKRHGLTRP
jgi:DNA-binding NtrC family response regulator